MKTRNTLLGILAFGVLATFPLPQLSTFANHDPARLEFFEGSIPENRPKVVHVNMGGTITSRSPHPLFYYDYGGHGNFSPSELIETVPEVNYIADIEIYNEDPIPQTDMPAAAKAVMEALAAPDVVGAVVTNGTWALEEVAYFLHLTVKSEKPVVVVGSQRPPNNYSTDAQANYFNAVRLAIDPEARGKGVMVLLNDEINSARDVTKGAIYRLQAFQSREFGPLGSTDADRVVFYRAPIRKHTYMSEFDVADFTAITDLPRVDIVYGCRGCDDVMVRAAIEAGAKGIVVAAMGDGWLIDIEDALKEAFEAGIVVVRSSRVGENRVAPWARYENIFVAGDNLTPQHARLLLALALTKTSSVQEVQSFFDEY
ncbi:asparaginase [Thermostichus vulcanus]|uniref:Asparaginase n=1 Tax=Thermostichus vulcanus str. 'Rupite' TaxID=2813851 RepID=A0ABT0CE97_THEVL|nr:asparaginase [Thermostichus vulcanus]MCJ2544117.1 asparaginase [Thermostichus vulcanus str. 'Rupite']